MFASFKFLLTAVIWNIMNTGIFYQHQMIKVIFFNICFSFLSHTLVRNHSYAYTSILLLNEYACDWVCVYEHIRICSHVHVCDSLSVYMSVCVLSFSSPSVSTVDDFLKIANVSKISRRRTNRSGWPKLTFAGNKSSQVVAKMWIVTNVIIANFQ